jgi:hypothetical protein
MRRGALTISMYGSLAASVITCFCVVPAVRPQEGGESKQAGTVVAKPPPITIPDGTPVQLRFAQPVRGKTRNRFGGIIVEAKTGDKVRMVVAQDVLVNEKVVISKGALGQATVTDVRLPTKVHLQHGGYTEVPETGLSLHLDWIGDVTGQKVPLRALPKGDAKPFTVEVLSNDGQLVARPERTKRDLIEILTFKNMVTMFHEKTWIPVGTRLEAFVNGSIDFDPEAIKLAQEEAPIPNPTAALTFYRRTRGHDDDRPVLSCDHKEVAAVGSRQFATVEIAPGKHECSLRSGKPVEISAEAGQQYFLQVRYSAWASGWELQQVKASEGEDEVADLEEITKQH